MSWILTIFVIIPVLMLLGLWVAKNDNQVRGVMVTGGGALIQGIDRMLSEKLQVPVMVAENPLQSVAIGTGILLNRIKADRGIFSGLRRLFSLRKS